MNESEMAGELIRQWEANDKDTRKHWELEVLYNYYGDRGAVDIYREERSYDSLDIHVYELKSEYAIKNAEGPNDVIRQFNRHRDCFFPGCDKYRKRGSVNYWLLIYATPYTIEWVRQHRTLFQSIEKRGYPGDQAMVALWHEELDTPAHPTKEGWWDEMGDNVQEVADA